jgi:hypothetical protein
MLVSNIYECIVYLKITKNETHKPSYNLFLNVYLISILLEILSTKKKNYSFFVKFLFNLFRILIIFVFFLFRWNY